MDPTQLMPEALQAAINAFEQLQGRYSALGASDSVPDTRFMSVIVAAVRGRSIDWDQFNWSLYDPEDLDPEDAACVPEAARLMTEQARRVYDTTRLHNHDTAVVSLLRAYCWRQNAWADV